ncbi:ABC transporter permease [candidate division KSB1 bacterium]
MMKLNNKKPSLFAELIIRYLGNRKDKHAILGDLEEEFNDRISKDGLLKAKLWYWYLIIISVGSFIQDKLYWSSIMLRNYLKVAFRNVMRYKVYSFINITGLAVGLACCIFIYLWVQNELSYDDFHENSERIFRVNYVYQSGRGNEYLCYPVADRLAERYPEINSTSRLYPQEFAIKYAYRIFNESGWLVEPSFFQMFSFPVIAGERENLLHDPFSVVISEKAAVRYFGDSDPVGKILILENDVDLTVSSVISIPVNSTFRDVDFFLAPEINKRFNNGVGLERYQGSWSVQMFPTFIRLNQGVSQLDIEAKISGLLKEHLPESTASLKLQSLKDVNLFTPGGQTGTKLYYIYIFSCIGFFILIIACINFVNMATARSEKRSKEVGLRKTIGANRTQLIRQFFTESVILSLFAFLVAIMLVLALLPVFNSITGNQLYLDLSDQKVISVLTGVLVFTGLVSGSYPALYLSSFHPVKVLKGIGFRGTRRSGVLRRVLVTVQFSISIILIISTVIVYSQIRYFINKDRGYDSESLVYISFSSKGIKNYKILKNELLKHPQVLSATASRSLPFYVYWMGVQDWEGKESGKNISFNYTMVDADYLSTMKMELVSGNDFSGIISLDKNGVMFNEEAIKQMKIRNPIGKKVIFQGEERTIVGVVKDFHCRPLNEEINPLIISFEEEWDVMEYLIMRLKPGSPADVRDYSENIWKKLNPNLAFEFNFFDEEYERLYNDEKQLGKILVTFTSLAIIVSCLGLFGLTSYIVEQKNREIGIRKTFGARVNSILYLLSKEIILMVLLSAAITIPVILVIMNRWLENFAYRIDLNPLIFLIPVFALLAIVIVTISWQTLKASISNPAELLRYE